MELNLMMSWLKHVSTISHKRDHLSENISFSIIVASMMTLASLNSSGPMSFFFSFQHEIKTVNSQLLLHTDLYMAMNHLSCEVLWLLDVDEEGSKLIL